VAAHCEKISEDGENSKAGQDQASPGASFLLLQGALALCSHGAHDVVRLALGPNAAQFLNQAGGVGAGAVLLDQVKEG